MSGFLIDKTVISAYSSLRISYMPVRDMHIVMLVLMIHVKYYVAL